VRRSRPLGNLSDEEQLGGIVSGVLGSGSNDDDDDNEVELETYLQVCGCTDYEEAAAILCLQECSKKSPRGLDYGKKKATESSTTLVTREAGCSECERQLYRIVQQLQAIFTIGAGVPEVPGVPSVTNVPSVPNVPGVPGVPSVSGTGGIPKVNDAKVATPAIDATTLAPAQLRRRALQIAAG